MKLANGGGGSFFRSRSQSVGSLEIAALAQDIVLPKVNTEPLTLTLLEQLSLKNLPYKMRDQEYKSEQGLFFIPVLTPNVLQDEVHSTVTTSAQLAKMTSAQLNTMPYDTTNCIPLIIPKQLTLPFTGLIPKGTRFLITFLGGKIDASKIKIVGIFVESLVEEKEPEYTITVRGGTRTNSGSSGTRSRNSSATTTTSNTGARQANNVSVPSSAAATVSTGGLNYAAVFPQEYWNAASRQGRIETDIYGGKNIVVYLPPGYSDSTAYNIFYFKMGTNNTAMQFWNWPGQVNNFNNVVDNMISHGDCGATIICSIDGNAPNTAWLQDNALGLFQYVESRYSTYARRDTSQSSLESSCQHRALGGWSLGSIEVGSMLKNDRGNNYYKMVKWWDIQSGYNPAGYDKLAGRSNMFVGVACGTNDTSCTSFTNSVFQTFKNNSFFEESTDGKTGNYKVQIVTGYTHAIQCQHKYFYNALKYFF